MDPDTTLRPRLTPTTKKPPGERVPPLRTRHGTATDEEMNRVHNVQAFGLGVLVMFCLYVFVLQDRPETTSHATFQVEIVHKRKINVFNDPSLATRFPEHVLAMRNSTFHQRVHRRWKEQGFSRPYLDQEREAPCKKSNATEENFLGLSIVRAALQNAGDHYPLRLKFAKKAFRRALQVEPSCLAPRLNLIILLIGEAASEEDSPEGEPVNSVALTEREVNILTTVQDLFKALPEEKWSAKMLLWKAIYDEFANGVAGSPYFAMAFVVDPSLRNEYIHPTYTRDSILQDARQRPAAPVIRRGLVQLLFHYEFAPATGAYGKFKIEDAMRFKRDWRGKVDNFLPPFCYLVIARTYGAIKDKIERQEVDSPPRASHQGAASYESNADALNEWYNIRIKEFMDRFVGVDTFPTYGFSAGYVDGDTLRPHTDRKLCEFTLTVLVSAHPHPSFCPLYAQKTPWKIDGDWVGRYEEETIHQDDVVNLQPQLNQLVILRGRAVPHFRPALPKSTYCQTFMAHFTTYDHRRDIFFA